MPHLDKIGPWPTKAKVSADNSPLNTSVDHAYTVELSLFIFMRPSNGYAL